MTLLAGSCLLLQRSNSPVKSYQRKKDKHRPCGGDVSVAQGASAAYKEFNPAGCHALLGPLYQPNGQSRYPHLIVKLRSSVLCGISAVMSDGKASGREISYAIRRAFIRLHSYRWRHVSSRRGD